MIWKKLPGLVWVIALIVLAERKFAPGTFAGWAGRGTMAPTSRPRPLAPEPADPSPAIDALEPEPVAPV